MNIFSLGLFLLSLSAPSIALAAFPFIETGACSTQTHPTPSLPGKSGTVTDSNFGTTILRFTGDTDVPGTPSCTSPYGTYDPVSNDDKYIFVGCSGFRLFNLNTGVYVKSLGTWLQWYNGQDPEPRWDRSGNHNSRLYYRHDMSLKWVDVDTDATGTVRNFSADFPTGNYIYNGEEGSPSSDNRYWAFMVDGTNKVFTYDMTENVIIATLDTGGAGIDHVEMSPDGNWVEISWITNQSTYNRNLDIASRVITNTSSVHGNWAKSRQGHVGYVNFRSDGDYLEFIRADGGEDIDFCIPPT